MKYEGTNERRSEGTQERTKARAIYIHKEINKYIESGQEVPHDLSKNFIKINLIDNPFDSIE